MKFLSNVLAVIVGLLIFWVLAFFLLAGIIAISASEDKVTVEDNSVLHLNLERRNLIERAPEDDFNFANFGPFGGVQSVGLNQVVTAIRTAKENENIRGIYLQSGSVMAGQALLADLRKELEEFKTSGKFVIAYSEFFSESGYYLASVADEVYMNPQGMLEFNGLASEMVFLKGLFEKLEVEPIVFRVGEFKSAVEPFILDKMSEESRLQTASFLNDLNDYMLAAISESRSLPLERVTTINDGMLVRKTKDAVELGLIDGLWYDDQVKNLLREKLGIDEEDEINAINITRINKSASPKNRLSRNRIAVIIADGDIMPGNSEDGISSENYLKEIRKIRKNKDVKAIVLRINSPGGSILASDVIWRELDEAQKEKPLIASMSNVAASGGYYIAVTADTIVAQPNTITGSIGIFGLWFNAQGLLNNKLGITTDVVKSGEYSDFLSPTRRMSEAEKTIMQNMVEEGYDTFINRVADGRSMSKDSVLKVASGRVWSGLQAKDLGLVDILGSLEDAIKIAAEKAGVEDDYRIIYYPEQKNFFERLLSEFSKDIQTAYTRLKTGGNYFHLYQQIDKLKNFEGVMVRLPYDIEIF